MNRFIEELTWRGMIHDHTPNLAQKLTQGPMLGYIGFDATAPSLQIGNLAAIMLLKHFERAGHRPVIVLGGGTTLIGDPGGRKTERQLIDHESAIQNQKNIEKQFRILFNFNHEKGALLFNNYDWYKNMDLFFFLREVGKYIPLTYMMNKESVKQRLSSGISYAEFSYQLLQGYDFFYLYNKHGVNLQMGGSDQWGNLTTGIELIRRKAGGDVSALTMHLITNSEGAKFGKSAGNALWLDPQITSPYTFYQFWINQRDDQALKMLPIFTFLNQQEVSAAIISHEKAPHKRIVQGILAQTMTQMIHGEKVCQQVKRASAILFAKESKLDDQLDYDTFVHLTDPLPIIHLDPSQWIGDNDIVNFLVDHMNGQLFASRRQAREIIENGGLRINKKTIDLTMQITDLNWLFNRYLLVQKGRKNYFILDRGVET